MRNEKKNAYLTIYMSLVLTIILSLCLTLIEGTRQNGFYMESECITDIGMNSILAEYHRELLKQYNLFAIDSSYEKDLPGIQNTCDHLKNYLDVNLSQGDVWLDWLLYRDFLKMKLDEVSITDARFLSDGSGKVFRRRAAEAMWDDYNLGLYQELQDWLNVVESEKLTERDVAAEKKKLDRKLKSYDGKVIEISEKEFIVVKIKNPTAYLEKIRKEGILSWVIDDETELSGKTISEGELISFRIRAGRNNTGNMELEDHELISGELERFLFQEYLLKYMGNYLNAIPEHALDYQIEYLIVGNQKDYLNLQGVVNRIFAMREAANVSYLFSDQKKYTIAQGLGAALATAMTIPEAANLLTSILIFGWAFAESIYDVRCILAGERIPLMKTESSWHYDLEHALDLKGDNKGTNRNKEGLCYEDYLRIFLCLQKENLLTTRAMNMVEADIRLTPGNEQFRIDGCLDAVGACVKMKSAYGYECQIKRKKSYCMQ